MTKIFLFSLFLILSVSAISQTEKTKGSIGVSIPVIWNNSEATYYQLGSPKYRSGNAISYGLNINYSYPFYKSVYGKIGVGYFKQTFGIIRPFNYDSPIQFGWATNSYNYYNAHLYGGIGYKRAVSKGIFINGNVTYNQYYSFRQKYINGSPVSSQVNHKSIGIGRMVNFNIGVKRNIAQKISFGVDAILPVSTHWNSDEIFINNGYSTNEQQIARNKFSIGAAISCYYHF